MAKECSIIPQVRNNKGQIVDSRLFKDLLAYTGNNRIDTVRLYLITKNDKFIKDWNSKLTLDENNEPTLRSLLKQTNISDVIPESKVLEKLNRDINVYNKETNKPALWDNNDENYQNLIQKAINFNQNSDFKDDYVAKIFKIQDSESLKSFIGIKVEKRNRLNSIEADKMEYNYNLNNKLRQILLAHGITTGALTDLEKRMGINGVTDFDTAKKAATGLIEMIRLANGIEGEKALPEEFAHFAIEAMGESPFISRLINNINSNNLTNEILGDEYDTYDILYKGDTFKLAKEAAGKLLAKHLLKSKPIEQKPYKNILERVINAIKSFFKTINANQIQKAMYEADKDFSKLAIDILNGRMNEEINSTTLGKTILFQANNWKSETNDNITTVSLGKMDLINGSEIALFANIKNIEADSVYFKLESESDTLYALPYNYNNDVYTIPGKIGVNKFELDLNDRLLVNGNIEIYLDSIDYRND